MPHAARSLLTASAGAVLAVGAAATAAHAAEPAAATSPGSTPGNPAAAEAADPYLTGDAPTAATSGVSHAFRPIGGMKMNPLSGTGMDPLTNGVGTQVADFKPLSTTDLTVPLSNSTVGDLPLGAAGM